jgi:hypothetical protein
MRKGTARLIVYLTLIRMPVIYLPPQQGMPMAFGSMRQMRSYADKVFDRDARLAQRTDGRADPTIPLGAVLSTWHGKRCAAVDLTKAKRFTASCAG